MEKTIYGDVALGVNGKIDASAKGADTATQLMLVDRLNDKQLTDHLKRIHIGNPAAFFNKMILTREAMAA